MPASPTYSTCAWPPWAPAPTPPGTSASSCGASRRAEPSSSEAGTPAILPGDSDGVEVAPAASQHTGAAEQLDGLMRRHRQRHGPAHTDVLPPIVALHAAHRGPAAIQVRHGHGAPDAPADVVDGVALHGEERSLVARLAQEVVVPGEERDAGRELQADGAQALRESQLGLDRPAVGADVHQLVGVVLAEGQAHPEAESDDEVLLIAGEFLHRE